MSAKAPELNLSGWGPYPGADDLGAVVAEVGSYASRLGYAGEDCPRSIFRTEAAVLREGGGKGGCGGKGGGGGGAKGGGKGRGGRIMRRRHGDWWNRPLEDGGTDGAWEIGTPVDAGTGLIYEAPASDADGSGGGGGSANSNEPPTWASGVSDGGGGGSGSGPGPGPGPCPGHGECYETLSSYLRHGYSTGLLTRPSDSPLLLVERSYNVPPIRQRTLEVLFEDLGVPAAFLARDAVTACYAVGRATGTVVDVGHSGTVVTPVYEGYVEGRGVLRSGAGTGGSALDGEVLSILDGAVVDDRARRRRRAKSGRYEWQTWRDDVTTAMPLYQCRMRRDRPDDAGARSGAMHVFARMELARQCKESGAGCAAAPHGYASRCGEGESETMSDSAAELRERYSSAPGQSFELPDGTVVEVSQLARYDAAEVLFGDDAGSVRKREEGVAAVRSRLNDVLAASSSVPGDSAAAAAAADDCYDATGSTISPTGLRSVKSSAAGSGAGAGSGGRRRPRPHSALVRAALPYLQSNLPELTAGSVQSMVCDSAFRCDRDQQPQLLGNVVLCGGGACLGPDECSAPDRLRDGVEAIIHAHTPGWRVKVLSPDRRERRYASWLGASIMASLGTFHDFWIGRGEYDEFGPGIVNRKCP